MIDLEKPADVYAVQINYHDYQSNMYGRYEGLHHRYLIEGSLDGENWEILVDRKESYRDTPKGAQGYNILWGIAPDKLYSSWMVYDKTDLLMKTLTADQDYYFCVEAFNENGVSLRSEVKHVK